MRRHKSGIGFEEFAFSDMLKANSFVTSVWNKLFKAKCVKDSALDTYDIILLYIINTKKKKGDLPVEVCSEKIAFSNLPVE